MARNVVVRYWKSSFGHVSLEVNVDLNFVYLSFYDDQISIIEDKDDSFYREETSVITYKLTFNETHFNIDGIYNHLTSQDSQDNKIGKYHPINNNCATVVYNILREHPATSHKNLIEDAHNRYNHSIWDRFFRTIIFKKLTASISPLLMWIFKPIFDHQISHHLTQAWLMTFSKSQVEVDKILTRAKIFEKLSNGTIPVVIAVTIATTFLIFFKTIGKMDPEKLCKILRLARTPEPQDQRDVSLTINLA